MPASELLACGNSRPAGCAEFINTSITSRSGDYGVLHAGTNGYFGLHWLVAIEEHETPIAHSKNTIEPVEDALIVSHDDRSGGAKPRLSHRDLVATMASKIEKLYLFAQVLYINGKLKTARAAVFL
jgi:hypothetical protein